MIAGLIAIPQLATWELRLMKIGELDLAAEHLDIFSSDWLIRLVNILQNMICNRTLLCDFSTRFYCVAAMSFAFGCSACAYSGDIINTLRWNLFQQ